MVCGPSRIAELVRPTFYNVFVYQFMFPSRAKQFYNECLTVSMRHEDLLYGECESC